MCMVYFENNCNRCCFELLCEIRYSISEYITWQENSCAIFYEGGIPLRNPWYCSISIVGLDSTHWPQLTSPISKCFLVTLISQSLLSQWCFGHPSTSCLTKWSKIYWMYWYLLLLVCMHTMYVKLATWEIRKWNKNNNKLLQATKRPLIYMVAQFTSG